MVILVYIHNLRYGTLQLERYRDTQTHIYKMHNSVDK
jgi:hypothetical protein